MIDITGIPILAERLAEAQKAADGEQNGAGLHTHDPIEFAIQELLAALRAGPPYPALGTITGLQ